MAQHQWDTPAFRQWFGHSIVRDRNGQPARCYHGTPVWAKEDRSHGDFDTFNRAATTVSFPGRKPGADAVGSWFSDRPDQHGAGMYAGSEGAIYPVYLRITNPWRPRTFMEFIEKGRILAGLPKEPRTIGKSGMREPMGAFDPEPLRRWLVQNGHDGIMFGPEIKVDMIRDGEPQRIWVALEPSQIKSATGNAGGFDSNSPKITEGIADQVKISYSYGTGYSAHLNGRLVGRMILNYPDKERPGTVSVFKVKVDIPRQGIGRKLYDFAKAEMAKEGLRLVPSEALSDEGLSFWSKYEPDAVRHEGRIWGKSYVGKTIEWKDHTWKITSMSKNYAIVERTDGSRVTSACPIKIIFDQLGPMEIPARMENFQPNSVNNRQTDEGIRMSLRAMIAEAETEYRYTVFSPVNLHDPATLAMVRIALGGRMARDIAPKGVAPWTGGKSDKFPEMAMKPVYSIELVTGIPLNHRLALQELALALNIEQNLLQITGKDIDPEPEVEPNGSSKVDCPYDKDGVTPNFLSAGEKSDANVSLSDLIKSFDGSEPHEEVKDVYEGFSITQIEAEIALGEDLQRGYYVVRGLGQNRVGISGPYPEVPINYPLNLDRARELREAQISSIDRGQRLVEYDVNLRGQAGGQQEPQHYQSQLASVRVQDTDTGKEYPVLVTVGPGMGDEEVRNSGVQQVARKLGIPMERLIAMDPNRAQAA